MRVPHIPPTIYIQLTFQKEDDGGGGGGGDGALGDWFTGGSGEGVTLGFGTAGKDPLLRVGVMVVVGSGGAPVAGTAGRLLESCSSLRRIKSAKGFEFGSTFGSAGPAKL